MREREDFSFGSIKTVAKKVIKELGPISRRSGVSINVRALIASILRKLFPSLYRKNPFLFSKVVGFIYVIIRRYAAKKGVRV